MHRAPAPAPYAVPGAHPAREEGRGFGHGKARERLLPGFATIKAMPSNPITCSHSAERMSPKAANRCAVSASIGLLDNAMSHLPQVRSSNPVFEPWDQISTTRSRPPRRACTLASSAFGPGSFQTLSAPRVLNQARAKAGRQFRADGIGPMQPEQGFGPRRGVSAQLASPQ